MNIYFSCSITGGRKDQATYEKIVDHLVKSGHDVPTAHLSRAEVLEDERVVTPLDVYERDVNWVEQCDLVVAEVSTPSHGVGYEIALALLQGKPVFCCYKQGCTVSKMILGNTLSNLSVYAYRSKKDLFQELDRYFEGINLH
jgi:2'-deoxynucleoside 5'-phosphate N-hydrolase